MVHMSDVMCALIAKECDEGATPCDAITASFTRMPGEIVGLLLSLSTPKKIAWSKINRPMFLSFSSHGAYLASCPIAFPEDAADPINLPELSSGYVTKNSFTAKKYENPPINVAVADAKTIHDAYDTIVELLSEERSFNTLKVGHLFPKSDGILAAAGLKYSILYSLWREGKLDIKKIISAGKVENTTTTAFTLKLKS